MVIGDTCKYSDYVGPIDTLIVSGGVGAVTPQPPELIEMVTRARCSHSTRCIHLYRRIHPRGCRPARWMPRCDSLAILRPSPEPL